MKAIMLRIVNILLCAVLLLQAVTVILFKGFMMFETVSEVHEIAGYVMFGLIAAHIVLNWPWIRANILRFK